MSQKDKDEEQEVHRLEPMNDEPPAKELWRPSEVQPQAWKAPENEPEPIDPEESFQEDLPKAFKIPIGFQVLLVVVLAFLGIWGLIKSAEGERGTRARLEALAEAEEKEKEETKRALSLIDRLERAIKGYLDATSLEEISNYVRHSERVAPLMKNYYGNKPVSPRPFAKIDDFASLGIEKRSFMLVKVLLQSDLNGRRGLHLIVEETEEGDILVDWESDVAYQPVPLEEFLESKSERPTDLRLFVEKDNFYNYEFSDADRYQSLKLGNRDSDVYFFGYVERGSRAHEEIEKLLEKSKSGFEPALLRVRFLPGSESRRSVLVEDVVAPRWIYTDDPRDKSS